jgi:ribonuclease BN (tRNA processing enzyme)
MKLIVFQSDKGDCLLLTSADGKNVLIDGGMSNSYTTHVAPALNKLHIDKQVLDLVYVSHIDQDHIAGVLKMADDLMAWRVFDFQREHGNTTIKPPKVPRPPEVKVIWHNSFSDMLGKNKGPIEEQLASCAALLSSRKDLNFREVAAACGGLATSMGEAVRLNRRIGPRQLNVPLNPDFAGKLMIRDGANGALNVGSMSMTIIGPAKKDLENLRKDWNDWLQTVDGAKQVEGIRKRADKDDDLLNSSEVGVQLGSLYAEADALAIALAKKLGNRKRVTLPNLASLMFLVEENGKSLLLTGDGHWQDILDGLEVTGKLAAGGSMFVDVLKVQHHGAEYNWEHEFGRRVIARNYVFCGNGSEENPELDVVQAVIDSRLGAEKFKSKHPKTGQKFKLWFNCSSAVDGSPKFREHMKDLEKLVKNAAAAHLDRVDFHFLSGSSQRIPFG